MYENTETEQNTKKNENRGGRLTRNKREFQRERERERERAVAGLLPWKGGI